MRGAIAALCLGLAACGDDDAFLPAEDAAPSESDAGGFVDGGGQWGDASVPCAPVLELPEEPILVDQQLVVLAGGFDTSETVEWTVWRPDESFVALPPGSNQQQLELVVDRVGSWEIEVRACGRADKRTFHVDHPRARTGEIRLRFWPTPGQQLPAQEHDAILSVPGGGPYEIPWELRLDKGEALSGLLELDQDGARSPLGGELRLVPARGPSITVVAGDDGHYAGRVSRPAYRLDVVPRDARRASLRRGVTTDELQAGLVVDAGRLVHGTVTAGGLPVAGATVALSLGELPAAFDVTDELGRFAVRAHEGGPLALRVDGEREDLPAVVADPGLALVADGGDIEVELPAPASVPAQLEVTSSTGAPLAGASLVLLGDGLAGSVRQDERSGSARHDTRRRLVTDAGGVAAASLPPGSYQVVIEPPVGAGEVMTVHTVEIIAAPTGPVQLKTSPPSARRLRLVDARDGRPVGDEVTVLAVSRGYAGVGAGVAVAGLPPDDVLGTVDLPLVSGVAYDVLVVPRGGSPVARQRVTLPAGDASEILEVRLERRMILRGLLKLPGGGPARNVRVSAVCAACATPDDELGETRTTSLGEFRLEMPDPGVETP